MTEETAVAEPLQVRFDTRLFSLPVVKKACLRFSGIASFNFVLEAEHVIRVDVTPSAGLDLETESFKAQLHNEVLDQSLRETVACETESERNLILAYAFSNTKLIGA